MFMMANHTTSAVCQLICGMLNNAQPYSLLQALATAALVLMSVLARLFAANWSCNAGKRRGESTGFM